MVNELLPTTTLFNERHQDVNTAGTLISALASAVVASNDGGEYPNATVESNGPPEPVASAN